MSPPDGELLEGKDHRFTGHYKHLLAEEGMSPHSPAQCFLRVLPAEWGSLRMQVKP